MKILHEPYGIDDPYKTAPCERYPRDPRPGDEVQVRFKVEPGAEFAWADVITGGDCRRVEAKPLGDGFWTVDLGRFQPGLVSYELGARAGAQAADPAPSAGGPRFHFEVGAWHRVVAVHDVVELPDRVRLRLATSREADATDPSPSTTAHADITFPLPGAARVELFVDGTTDPAEPASAATHRVQRSAGAVSIEAPGIELTIGLEDLRLEARTPGADGASYAGSLAYDWLAQADGQVSEVRARFETRQDEWLYGLGERFTGANRNGDSWDVRVYEEYKEQGKRTYLPVPFVVSNRGYGLWLDADEPSHFDLRTSQAVVSLEKFVEPAGAGEAHPRARAGASEPLIASCIFVAEKPYDVTAAFTRLSGEIAVPPKWAFSPWMSSNSWNSQALAEAAVERTLAEDVPAGVIVIEAWSDESTFYIFNDAEYEPRPGAEAPRLSDFTFRGRWPDPKAFIDRCHQHGIRVVLWQIPVLKHLGEPHPQHDNDERHMIERRLAIENADGTPYRNKGWWFTHGLVVDFTNPAARAWWFAKRRYLFDELGIDGMKTDGGEHLWGRDLRARDGRRGLELVNAYANEYVGAYHEFVKRATGDDGVTFSRAGFTGAQRFPGHWAGDEDSSWDAYRASIRAGLAAGVSGVSMWSWDIGGFSGEIPPVELYLRSTAMAVLSPLMQYHSEGHGASEVRDRTPWNIAERHADASALELYRRFAKLRERLLDLIHEDAVSLSAEGLPLMRYPALAYPQEHHVLSQDPYAYLFGRDLLVAPVVDKGVGARAVRLPSGGWVDAWSGSEFGGGRVVQATATIERIPVFVRADSPRLQRWLAAFKEPQEGRD